MGISYKVWTISNPLVPRLASETAPASPVALDLRADPAESEREEALETLGYVN